MITMSLYRWINLQMRFTLWIPSLVVRSLQRLFNFNGFPTERKQTKQRRIANLNIFTWRIQLLQILKFNVWSSTRLRERLEVKCLWNNRDKIEFEKCFQLNLIEQRASRLNLSKTNNWELLLAWSSSRQSKHPDKFSFFSISEDSNYFSRFLPEKLVNRTIKASDYH